jgi:hypothetical protein
MSSAISATPSNSAVNDQALAHIGAQFYCENEISSKANVAKASGPAANIQELKDSSLVYEALDKYLQTADRTEILCLGICSSRSARVFDRRLICMIDGVLLQIERPATETALSSTL